MLCHDYRDHKNLTKVSAFTVPLGFVNSGCKDSNGVTNDNATKKATENKLQATYKFMDFAIQYILRE